MDLKSSLSKMLDIALTLWPHLHPFCPVLHWPSTYLLNQIHDRRMNVSTSVNSLLIVTLSDSIVVSANISGNNDVEIQFMLVRIIDFKNH